MAHPLLKEKKIIDVIKYRWTWIIFSLCLIIPSILIMIYSSFVYETHSPLKLGIDFTGGTLLKYGFDKEITKDDIAQIREGLSKAGVENAVIQVEKASKMLTEKAEEATDNTKLKSVVSIRTKFLASEKGNNESLAVNNALRETIGSFTPLQVSAIGPTLGKELFKNSIAALLLAFVGIVIYLTVRFSLDYALFALVALAHDAIFVCGVFSLFGLLFGTEIDSLFITAILTVIGFSVHDTIVVYDRIRENSRFLAKKASFNDIVNASVNQTLARSINTSVTTLLTLGALFLLGGSTTKDFVLAMMLGIAIGTYSSIFNASTLLAMYRESRESKKGRKKATA